MALESGTYISDLNPSNPVGATDKVSTLDDHVRLIKSTLQNTFPNIDGAVTATEDELNHLDGVTGTTGTGRLVLDDAPTIADLTVTDSITLPAASIADAALSDNVPLKNASNTFTSGQQVVGGANSRSNAVRFQRAASGSSASQLIAIWDEVLGNFIQSESAIEAPKYLIIRATTNDAGDEPQQGSVEPAVKIRGRANSDLAVFSDGGITLNGNADISGTLTVGGVISAPNGSAAAPAYSFSTDSDLGIYRVGGNRLGISCNGTTVASFATDEIDLTATTLDFNGAVRAGTAATSTSGTLVAGQIHHRSSNTTVPSMNAGQWVAVQNTSTSSITLSQGSGVTLELGGTTMTGNRTLLPKGFAFIYFRANGVGVVHGSGVT